MSQHFSRNLLHVATAAALVATLGLAGCKKKDETAMTPPPSSEPAASPPMETPPPAATPPATLSVTTVDLGNAIGADNRIATPSTSFAKTDAIHASVATDGPGGAITAKWTMGDKLVNSTDKTVAAGPQVTEFSISKPDGWPAGHYKLDVTMGGRTLQSREFDVK